jgi:RNA polymerase sigma-70 factor, ECF subfamily
MSDSSTQTLVRLIQAGDAVATDQLFARYLPRVASMVALELGVPRRELSSDAEDIVQDAILRALKALPEFEVRSPGAFAAWLARIVENCVRQRRVTQGNVKSRLLWQRYGDMNLSESFFSSQDITPSGILSGAESNRLVEQALLALPSVYRRVLSLRHLAGATYAEIAQELGRTEANCRKVAQRAIEMLRAEMAG